MTALDALLELLERVGASRHQVAMVSEEELRGWPADAVRELKAQKLLVKASPAASVVCPGCEQQCTMPVHSLPVGSGPATSFIVCDKRDDINRVGVSAERLNQWRCGVEAVGRFVARGLELRPESQRKMDAGLWELGLVRAKKRQQMICLRANGTLQLIAGQNEIPLAEFLGFGEDGYSISRDAVRDLVEAATTADPRYTPSHVRREARKQDTQEKYQSWQKEYRTLKRRRPEMSDVWYSRQIARMDIAEGCSTETIRKHMKR
jgi:hypothetical protein